MTHNMIKSLCKTCSDQKLKVVLKIENAMMRCIFKCFVQIIILFKMTDRLLK